uniref:BTB domain-containing protein n=1 Tax=Leersia perrieri TaxID=77586 RepID=A0A0D9XUD4_9ORYZ
MTSSSTSSVAAAIGSTSTIIAPTKPTGHHILKIDGYSRTKAMFAAACSITTAIDPVPSYTLTSTIRSFHGSSDSSKEWIFPQFISHDDLEKSEHLKGDRFAVRCDVTLLKGIVEVRAEPVVVPSMSVPDSDIHCHLARLLSTGEGVDATLKVGGETFAAHRCVLAARSPVLKNALYIRRLAAGGCVDVDDMDATAFRAFLQFLYTDTLMEMNSADVPAMAQQLIVAADKYKVERLKLVCEDK